MRRWSSSSPSTRRGSTWDDTGRVVSEGSRFASLESNDLQFWVSKYNNSFLRPMDWRNRVEASKELRAMEVRHRVAEVLQHLHRRANTLDERSTAQMALLERISADLEKIWRVSFVFRF